MIPNIKKFNISLVLTLLLMGIGSILSYLLSNIPSKFYDSLQKTISYKSLFIILVLFILTMIYYFIFKRQISTNNSNADNSNNSEQRITKQKRQALKNLTQDEKVILKEYLEDSTRTSSFDFRNGTVQFLIKLGILFTPFTEIVSHSYYVPINIQPWAYEYLKKNRHLLD